MKKLLIFFAIIMVALPAVCQEAADVEYVFVCEDDGTTARTLIRIDIDVVGRDPLPLQSKYYTADGTEITPVLGNLSLGRCSQSVSSDQIIIKELCDYNTTTMTGTPFCRVLSVTPAGVVTTLATIDLTGAAYTPTQTAAIEGFCETDLELLEPECYRQQGGEFCDYNNRFPNNAGVGNTATIDSFYSDNRLISLNYPYEYITAGAANLTERTRFIDDFTAYVTANGYYVEDIQFAVDGLGLLNLNFTQTNLTINRYVTTLDSRNPQQAFGTVFPSNCVTFPTIEYKVYRDQLGAISIIVDNAGNVVPALPTDRTMQISCNVQLLEKQCYAVRTAVQGNCDSQIAGGVAVQEPLNPIANVFIDQIFNSAGLIPLPNYPYLRQSFTGGNSTLIQLQTDLTNYYNTQGIEFDQVQVQSTGTITVFNTTEKLDNYVVRVRRSNGTETSSTTTATEINCRLTYTSEIYEVYRNSTGLVNTVIGPNGQYLTEIPANATLTCCDKLCDPEEVECRVQNKTYHDVLSGTVKIYYADTYSNISVIGHSGSFSYSFDGVDPVVIPDATTHYGFNLPNQIPCEYQQTQVTIDATLGEVTVLVQY